MSAEGELVSLQHLERIDLLHPIIQASAHELVTRCQSSLKRTLLVVQGWRSLNDQALIYQKGRTLNRSTGVWEITDAPQVVTRAKPGTSAHNIVRVATGAPASMALDVIPLNDDGTIDWQPDETFWDDLYEIAWKVGLDPLGDPIGSSLAGDMGHFEEPAFRLKMEALGVMFPLLKSERTFA